MVLVQGRDSTCKAVRMMQFCEEDLFLCRHCGGPVKIMTFNYDLDLANSRRLLTTGSLMVSDAWSCYFVTFFGKSHCNFFFNFVYAHRAGFVFRCP